MHSPYKNNGYSTLYTSGLFASNPNRSPNKSPTKRRLPPTTPRRHRSSILPSTPSNPSPQKYKSSGGEQSVERSFDGVMKTLRRMGISTPGRGEAVNQSRWSAWSSEENEPQQEEGEGFWKGRKSSDTTRSARPKLSFRARKGVPQAWSGNESASAYEEEEGRKSSDGRSIKSSRSMRSVKSKKEWGRKSEDVERPPFDEERVPDVPALPQAMEAPKTPGKKAKLMSGLVRRLGLTPRKKGSSMAPSETMVTPFDPSQAPPLPLTCTPRTQIRPESNLPPPPGIRDDLPLPRKTSLSTLRSALTKKGSATTLRSVRSNHTTNTAKESNFGASCTSLVGFEMDLDAPPLPPGLPRPREWGSPKTPRRGGGDGKRTPKSSIGQPKLKEETSPSAFLEQMPRRAPETPKREEEGTPGLVGGDGDVVMGEDVTDESLETTAIFTPPAPGPAPDPMQKHPFASSLRSTTAIRSTSPLGNASPYSPFSLNSFSPAQSSTPLTAKAFGQGKDRKPSRLGSLLPALGPAPVAGHGSKPVRALRSKKSTDALSVSGASALGVRDVNAMGLPVPPRSATSLGTYSSFDGASTGKKESNKLMKKSKAPAGVVEGQMRVSLGSKVVGLDVDGCFGEKGNPFESVRFPTPVHSLAAGSDDDSPPPSYQFPAPPSSLPAPASTAFAPEAREDEEMLDKSRTSFNDDDIPATAAAMGGCEAGMSFDDGSFYTSEEPSYVEPIPFTFPCPRPTHTPQLSAFPPPSSPHTQNKHIPTPSADSLLSLQSMTTSESFGSALSHDTSVTAQTARTRGGGVDSWELERYLQEAERGEERGRGGGVGVGGGRGGYI
ncbi:hypothetical protein L202_08118 [Cryptococcus amylolentus CBS 6039]|uniref:Uncharacterized protein n=2 Tax=Cryptococcus amylolentus TaxID=104669 RepID=A0A1E3H8M3_9TREE|nr:hypothetical protein L202_08118 [Cryptococcus amylolentus CBS 6039]ODN72679.1 hypothetical protein L202_08118 [Cryptococcus amylolentus CBS 6039]ODN97888.1 hypothetical protein I350_07523 [Cryptococcus amylolentus CBS 6273]